jgi:hypothetical protein
LWAQLVLIYRINFSKQVSEIKVDSEWDHGYGCECG